MSSEIRVEGLKELVDKISRADKKLGKEFRDELRVVGTIIKDDAAERLSELSPKSAGGLRARFRREGVIVVEQNLRKTTGKRPDWGRRQMERALLPALDAKREEARERLHFATHEALRELLR